MAQALRVTEEQLYYIIFLTDVLGYDICHLRDEFEVNADDGEETYLIMDGELRLQNVTHKIMTGTDFHNTWKFVNLQDDRKMTEIEHI